jgi:hypothetical protein
MYARAIKSGELDQFRLYRAARLAALVLNMFMIGQATKPEQRRQENAKESRECRVTSVGRVSDHLILRGGVSG